MSESKKDDNPSSGHYDEQPIAWAPIVDSRALNSPDRKEAFIQELRAGSAPLARIILIAGEIPRPKSPRGKAIVTVPFLTVPTGRWSKVTTGDSIGGLVTILQERGGLWLAKHVSAMIEWTVGPARHPNGSKPSISELTTHAPATWIRADFQFVGAWNGRFSLVTPAARVAQNLWPIAMSPIIAILPDDIADKALPLTNSDEPISWQLFTKALDNTLHVNVQPSEVIRNLVLSDNLSGPNARHDTR